MTRRLPDAQRRLTNFVLSISELPPYVAPIQTVWYPKPIDTSTNLAAGDIFREFENNNIFKSLLFIQNIADHLPGVRPARNQILGPLLICLPESTKERRS
jgi:hypothetical protein